MVCQGCRYYRPVNSDAGQCRRGPPALILDQTGWLTVAADELGCGEFVGVQRPNDQDTPP